MDYIRELVDGGLHLRRLILERNGRHSAVNITRIVEVKFAHRNARALRNDIRVDLELPFISLDPFGVLNHVRLLFRLEIHDLISAAVPFDEVHFAAEYVVLLHMADFHLCVLYALPMPGLSVYILQNLSQSSVPNILTEIGVFLPRNGLIVFGEPLSDALFRHGRGLAPKHRLMDIFDRRMDESTEYRCTFSNGHKPQILEKLVL